MRNLTDKRQDALFSAKMNCECSFQSSSSLALISQVDKRPMFRVVSRHRQISYAVFAVNVHFCPCFLDNTLTIVASQQQSIYVRACFQKI